LWFYLQFQVYYKKGWMSNEFCGDENPSVRRTPPFVKGELKTTFIKDWSNTKNDLTITP
jgi:hypothetical protein